MPGYSGKVCRVAWSGDAARGHLTFFANHIPLPQDYFRYQLRFVGRRPPCPAVPVFIVIHSAHASIRSI